jgi:hypothetical protein
MDIVHFYQVAAAKARMFPEARFSYLTSALTAAAQLARGGECHDPEYHRRVRDLNVRLYREQRA